MKLDDQQLATVLAALRFWQRVGKAGNCPEAQPECDVLTNGGEVEGLTKDEIDDFCEEINADDGPGDIRMDRVRIETKDAFGNLLYFHRLSTGRWSYISGNCTPNCFSNWAGNKAAQLSFDLEDASTPIEALAAVKRAGHISSSPCRLLPNASPL